jgi:pimeloyl-ACP methyl ester carboxylesterase
MPGDLIGRPRLAPGAGFAAPAGVWRRAVRSAVETRQRPATWGALRTTWLATPQGRLCARIATGPRAPALPAVLVHGIIVSSRYLLPLAAELAADRPVLVPDLPGYGLSEPGPPAPTLAALADAVIAAATAAGHARVALVGNSFGAQVAAEAAVRHPARVERLVLIGPTADPAARTLPRHVLRWLRNAPDEHPSVLPVMARDLADIGPRRAVQALRLMLEDRMEDRLAGVTVPTLVLRGGRDRLVPQAWAIEVGRLLAHDRLAVLPGYAHMPHWSGALAVAATLRPFLAAD